MPPLTAPTNALISLDPSELNPQNRTQNPQQPNRGEQVPRGPEIDPGRVQDFLNQPSDSGEVPAVTPSELTQDSQLRLNADDGGNANPGSEPTFDNGALTAGFTTTADQAQTGAPGTFGAEVLTARPSNGGQNAADAQQVAQNPADGGDRTTAANEPGAANDTPDQFQDLVDQVNARQEQIRQDTLQTEGDETLQDALVNRNADRIDTDQQQQQRQADTAQGADQQNVNDQQQQAANAEQQQQQAAANQDGAQTAGNFDGNVLNAGNQQTAGNFDGDVLTNGAGTGNGDIGNNRGFDTQEATGVANDSLNANDSANEDNVVTLADDGAENVTTDGTTFSAEERQQFQQLTEQVNQLQNEIDEEQGIGGATIQDGILNRGENNSDTRAAEPATNDQFAEDNENAPGSVNGTANDAAGNVLPDNPTQSLNA